ncbi:MAG: hypothetical protein QXD23_02385, partial [Candidatus Micrarchaeaceae archaeon]
NFFYLFYIYVFQKEKITFKGIIFKNWYNSKKFKYFFLQNKKTRELQMNIKNDIYKFDGVIKYLSLDKNLVIEKLYKKLGESNLNPEDVFIYLLIARYNLGVNYFNLINKDFYVK